MPPASQTEHRTILNTAIPYISNASITSTDPHFLPGSMNILTSLRNWSEKFPGFSTTIVPGTWQNLRRQFLWRRWVGSSPHGGAFIWMGCDIQGGVATVWKFQFNIDSAPVLIWTSASGEPFDFVVSNNTCYFGNGLDMKKYDSQTVNNWGFAGPAAGPSLTLVGGTLNAFTSKCYVYTYWNGTQESSPSPVSTCSGVFAAKNVQLGVVASPDSQVTGIRIYATPDGGAQDPTLMQEISGSPFPNATTTYTDSTQDVNLSIRTAPQFLRNDPPTPSKGFITYAGRIWGFANNTVYFSGFEEISNGVPEECWPSGLQGNNRPYATEVFALAPLIDGVAVFQALQVGKIEGEDLETFRRYTLLEKRGTLSRTAVAALGGSVAWLDTSNTVWVSDLGEVGLPIRPDLAPINAQECFISIHISGNYHWVVVLDGTNGILYVLDLDANQWMPPRDVGTSAAALFSGQSSLGVIDLLLARNRTKALRLVSGTYTDDGNAYDSTIVTNLIPLYPDGNPSFQGTHDWTELKVATLPPTQVLQLTDDNPMLVPVASWVDLTPDAEPSPLIIQGIYLQTWRYPASPQSAQMMSLRFKWTSEVNFFLYTIDFGFHPAGG